MLISEIEHFIQEDLGYNDISCTLVPDVVHSAVIFVKQDCVLAGMEPAHSILEYFDLRVRTDHSDGDELNAGDTIFEVSGSAISILRAERLVLNFLGHLSGIATLTRQCVQQVTPFSNARVASTRKTTPGIRKFEKLAVIDGGGVPHRFNLSDSIMEKGNHIKLMGLKEAISAAKSRTSFTHRIDVAGGSAENALVAAGMGVDITML
ncbi:MAG: carboxylating nicotinate-nucleotide diphosphorylase, partial [Methanosarcinaceae archaeon]|nr:carboxylating nicotinate-nucleotide diphosphorylase [Methanosarcinaceae archaeon]